MSEEIIIDGVNVAECEYMLNNKIKGKQHCPAKAMPYAKETSCICRKSINTPYNFCKHNPNCYYKQLLRLQAENEELKEEIKKEKQIYKENVHYLACMTEQRNKLKFALEEIFNLCNKNITDCENCKKQECAICNKAPGFSAKIIKIISEVLKEQQ